MFDLFCLTVPPFIIRDYDNNISTLYETKLRIQIDSRNLIN